MGFRVRQSGVFWNDVDGTITDYKWTDVSPGANGGESEWVYLVPSVLIDGKKQAETQHMFLGGVEEWEISADGKTVTNRSGNNDPTATAGVFLGSLAQAADAAKVDAALPDTEAGEALTLAGIVGLRIRLEQQKDERATAKLGKRKSKHGKGEYERTNTIVTRVYGRTEQSTAKSAPVANRAPRAAATKGNGATGAVINVDEKARDIVLNLLAEAKGATTKNKIRVPVINLTASNPELAPFRSDLQSRIFDDAFLGAIEGVRFDRASGALSLEQ